MNLSATKSYDVDNGDEIQVNATIRHADSSSAPAFNLRILEAVFGNTTLTASGGPAYIVSNLSIDGSPAYVSQPAPGILAEIDHLDTGRDAFL